MHKQLKLKLAKSGCTIYSLRATLQTQQRSESVFNRIVENCNKRPRSESIIKQISSSWNSILFLLRNEENTSLTFTTRLGFVTKLQS
jgi:hypothetical protein